MPNLNIVRVRVRVRVRAAFTETLVKVNSSSVHRSYNVDEFGYANTKAPIPFPIFARMARIMSIDYGTKKIGFAVTDPLQITVNGLETQSQETYWAFLDQYLTKEEVEKVVIGHPEHLDGTPTKLHQHIIGLKRKIEKNFPAVEVVLHPEALTSKRAKEVIFKSGLKKKKRRDKKRIDMVAAMLILQDYLGHLE